MEDYLERQLAMFGPQRVWSYKASPQGGNIHRPGRVRALALAMIVTGTAWFFLQVGENGPSPWPGAGVTLGFAGVLILLVTWGMGRAQLRRLKGWQLSSLVISPLGLALIQGDVMGELEWDQLRDVKLKKRRGYFQVVGDPSTGLTGIVLRVEGAMILVADLYDRPIEMIHDRILALWQPERLEQHEL